MNATASTAAEATGPVQRSILKQGWVHKRGASALFNNWQRCWLVLYEINVTDTTEHTHVGLYVYADREHALQRLRPKHTLDPTQIEIEIPSGHAMQHIRAPFILETPARRFYLSAPSTQDRDDWVRLLAPFRTAGAAAQPAQKARSPNVFTVPPYAVGGEQKPSAPFEHHDSGFCSEPNGGSAGGPDDNTADAPALEFQRHAVLAASELSKLQARGNTAEIGLPPCSDAAAAWTQKYMALCAAKLDSETVHSQDIAICQVIGQFKEVAEVYAQRLIDVLHMQRTLEGPIGVPGCSAPLVPTDGENGPVGAFLAGNILLQLAADYEAAPLAAVREALQRASQELLATRAVSYCASEFQTALLVLVDYKGFRVVASAVLPLADATTLVDLASSHSDPVADAATLARMNQLGRLLNLKEHTVTASGVQATLSATVSAYRSDALQTDFVVNLGEIFPSTDALHPERRLRPEFIEKLAEPVASDTLRDDLLPPREQRSLQAGVQAASSLLEGSYLTSFVTEQLDSASQVPTTGAALTEMMHDAGINLCHLGRIAQLTRLPNVRELCRVEMVARACKHVFHERMRAAVLHFRKVAATRVADELRNYATQFFAAVLGDPRGANAVFTGKLAPAIASAYAYPMSAKEFAQLPRVALFLRMQQQCHVQFEDSADYQFGKDGSVPLLPSHLVAFSAHSKPVQGRLVPQDSRLNDATSEEQYSVYLLARHLALLGPRARLRKSGETAALLTRVADAHRAQGRFQEAQLYLTAALNLSVRMDGELARVYVALIANTAERARAASTSDPSAVPQARARIDELQRAAEACVSTCWGSEHALHIDVLLAVARASATLDNPAAERSHLESAAVLCTRIYGKTHVITAQCWLQLGQALLRTSQTGAKSTADLKQAIFALREALAVFRDLTECAVASCDAEFYLADALRLLGDMEAARTHCDACRQRREALFGLSHPLTIDSLRQLTALVLAPYSDYHGVVTPAVRTAFQTALRAYEREFKFLKQSKWAPSAAHSPVQPARSVTQSVAAPCGYAYRPFPNPPAVRDVSLPSDGTQSVVESALAHHVTPSGHFAIRKESGTQSTNAALMDLSRRMIVLQLRLASPRQLEIIRSLQERVVAPASVVRQVILRLVHLTPTVYLGELLQRLDDSDSGEALLDQQTLSELHILVHLVEKDELGVF